MIIRVALVEAHYHALLPTNNEYGHSEEEEGGLLGKRVLLLLFPMRISL